MEKTGLLQLEIGDLQNLEGKAVKTLHYYQFEQKQRNGRVDHAHLYMCSHVKNLHRRFSSCEDVSECLKRLPTLIRKVSHPFYNGASYIPNRS